MASGLLGRDAQRTCRSRIPPGHASDRIASGLLSPDLGKDFDMLIEWALVIEEVNPSVSKPPHLPPNRHSLT